MMQIKVVALLSAVLLPTTTSCEPSPELESAPEEPEPCPRMSPAIATYEVVESADPDVVGAIAQVSLPAGFTNTGFPRVLVFTYETEGVRYQIEYAWP